MNTIVFTDIYDSILPGHSIRNCFYQYVRQRRNNIDYLIIDVKTYIELGLKGYYLTKHDQCGISCIKCLIVYPSDDYKGEPSTFPSLRGTIGYVKFLNPHGYYFKTSILASPVFGPEAFLECDSVCVNRIIKKYPKGIKLITPRPKDDDVYKDIFIDGDDKFNVDVYEFDLTNNLYNLKSVITCNDVVRGLK